MTVVVVAAIALAATLAVAVAGAGSFASAATRARGVADESALAAAASARDLRAMGSTGPDACARAREVAGRWGGRVETCVAEAGGAVTVEACVSTGFGEACARARAGTRP